MKKVKWLITRISLIFAVSFLINLFWEVSHSVLYDWNKFPLENTVYYYVPRIIEASIGDATIITSILIIYSILKRGLSWMKNPSVIDWIIIIIAGILSAIIIEIYAKINDLWTYSPAMPTIIGIGITPLVQLAITTMVTIKIMQTMNV